MNSDQIELEICRAIDFALEKGVKLTTGITWAFNDVTNTNYCCALGCYYFNKYQHYSKWSYKFDNDLFKINQEFHSFMNGFDSIRKQSFVKFDPLKDIFEFYQLGFKIAEKYQDKINIEEVKIFNF